MSAEDHDRLEALAVQRGQSVEVFVLSAALSAASDDAAPACESDEAQALGALKAVLQPRIANAREGRVSPRSIADIAAEERAGRKG